MININYYKILGTKSDIPQSEIHKAYIRRVKQFHPDLNPYDPKAKAKFQALQEAYQTLSNPVKRDKYDSMHKEENNANLFNHRDNSCGEERYDPNTHSTTWHYETKKDNEDERNELIKKEKLFKDNCSNKEYGEEYDEDGFAYRNLYTCFGVGLSGGTLEFEMCDDNYIKVIIPPYTLSGTKIVIPHEKTKRAYGDKILVLTVCYKSPSKSDFDNFYQAINRLRQNHGGNTIFNDFL